MATTTKTFQLTLKRVLDKAGNPKPAQSFTYTRVGDEISFEVGCFDLDELRDALQRSAGSDEGQEVNLYVTDRFVLSLSAARQLLAVARKMENDLRKEGLLTDEP